ncbi:hypothetical protein N9L26_00220 [Candidatus Pacebacteria bacterium]|nr:hypothetical protein [Candidatus Paceibacterota bacterium]
MTNKSIYTAVAGLLVIVGFFYLVSYFVEQREREIVDGITLEVVKQQKTLTAISEVTDRNGADAVVEEIIKDCPSDNRLRFDTLLGNLANLNAAELAEVDVLFNACADYYAQRKAVMVARMEREFEVYQNLVELLAVVDDAITITDFKVKDWEQLVTLEKQRSNIFANQVRVQRDIIKALQRGMSVNSEEINLMLAEANNSNEEGVVINTQIDRLRLNLLDV